MWSCGLDLRSIKSSKVVVSNEGTCNSCLFVKMFDFLTSNS